MQLIFKPLLFVILFMSINIYTTKQFEAYFCKITPAILTRMKYTWRDDAPVALEHLRYLRISHYDFNQNVKVGELIIHKAVIHDLIEIFETLFEIKFPITSIKFVDDFNGSDDDSMSANNSSAFYARKVAKTDRWSNHSFGCAIDINPLLNPYCKKDFFCPKESAAYLNRDLNLPGMITKESYIYKLFIGRGWQWGGECFFERDGLRDFHHFQKIIPGLNKNTN